jgi:hypothetical protein
MLGASGASDASDNMGLAEISSAIAEEGFFAVAARGDLTPADQGLVLLLASFHGAIEGAAEARARIAERRAKRRWEPLYRIRGAEE